MDRRDFLTAKRRKKNKGSAQPAQTETARRITSGSTHTQAHGQKMRLFIC